MRKIGVLNLLSVLVLLFATNVASAQEYSVTDLGTLPGGNSSVAYKVNNLSQVAGNSTLPGNAYGHAFINQNGTLTDVGTLGGGWSVAFQQSFFRSCSCQPVVLKVYALDHDVRVSVGRTNCTIPQQPSKRI